MLRDKEGEAGDGLGGTLFTTIKGLDFILGIRGSHWQGNGLIRFSLFSEAEKKARILVGKRLSTPIIRTQTISQTVSNSLISVILFQQLK